MNPSAFLTPMAAIPASRTIVIAGGPGFIVGPNGTIEAHDARIQGNPNLIGFAAVDAGHCQIDPASPKDWPVFSHEGAPITVAEIESRWGESLRANMGIRLLGEDRLAPHVENRIGAPLAHDLENGGLPGGLRRWAGLTREGLAASPLSAVAENFDDSGPFAPDVIHDMLIVSLAMALAPLDQPLSTIVPSAANFRVWSSGCVAGHASYGAMMERLEDKGARRLASYLLTHGANVFTMLLSPYLPLDAVRNDGTLLDTVDDGSLLYNIPQTPLQGSAACASSLVNFCDGVGQLRSNDPLDRIEVALWGASDAPISGDGRLNEAFKIALVNEGQRMKRGIPPGESLRPFDRNMLGTVAGNLGGALVVTTLETAMRHFLDVVAVVPGWGQSNEAGGKSHVGGVGYRGGNAAIRAFQRAHVEHGLGINAFEYWAAHGTGTIVNSLTDMDVMMEVRRRVATAQGLTEPLVSMLVGAIKALVGHSWGAAGIPQVRECIKYVMGREACGVPNFQTLHPKIKKESAMGFSISASNHRRSDDAAAAIAAVQGFGGPNGAVAFLTANRKTLARYPVDERIRDAYFERMDDIRRESEARETTAYRTPGSALDLVIKHRWKGVV